MGSITQSVGTRRWTSQAPSNSRQKQCKRCRAPPLFLDGSSHVYASMILRPLHAGAVTAQSPGGVAPSTGRAVLEVFRSLRSPYRTVTLPLSSQRKSNGETDRPAPQTCPDSPSRRATPAVLAGMGGCFWRPCCGLARTGSPWRDLPPGFGSWNTVSKRFRHWVKADVFKRIFDVVSDEADMEFAMIDGTIVRVHRHGQGAKGGGGRSGFDALAFAGPHCARTGPQPGQRPRSRGTCPEQ